MTTHELIVRYITEQRPYLLVVVEVIRGQPDDGLVVAATSGGRFRVVSRALGMTGSKPGRETLMLEPLDFGVPLALGTHLVSED